MVYPKRSTSYCWTSRATAAPSAKPLSLATPSDLITGLVLTMTMKPDVFVGFCATIATEE
jgi:hypothetical protein